VLAQTDVDVEIIVVIDGGEDETERRLQSYDPDRVSVLLNAENEGAQASRNRGLAAAGGEFVMFLDADDLVEGRLLAGLAEALQAEQADVAFAPMQILEEASGRRRPPFVPDYRSAEDLFTRWYAYGEFVAPCSVLWRTEFLRSLGGWDVAIRRNQDGEVVLRAIMCGGRFALSTEGRGIYVNHGSSMRISKRSDNMEGAFDVAEKLLKLPSTVISDALKSEVCGRRYYMLARNCYAKGLEALGAKALERSRARLVRRLRPALR
jgi:glycosyltransferase involved in cell wall biosynthesis